MVLRTLPPVAVGGFLAVGFGYAIFTWLVGPDSFCAAPLTATVLPLSIPISMNYGKYQKLKQYADAGDEDIRAAVAPLITSCGAGVFGEAVGVLAGAFWFAGK